MQRILLILLLVSCVAVKAQKAPVKFGAVTLDELRMSGYEKDSSASAVVLADFGESSLNYIQDQGFVLSFEHIKRIKIITKDGYEFANISIPLYTNGKYQEELIGLKAVTYNLENGKIVESKLKNENVFKETADKYLEVMKFALPNVKEGSILEISYRVTSPFWFNFRGWDFQSTIPVQLSEYRIRIPEFFRYKQQMRGYLEMSDEESSSLLKIIKLTYKERGNTSLYNPQASTFETENIDYRENYQRWSIRNVAAFREEPYLTTYRNYISRIDFELSSIQMPNKPVKNYLSSWEELNADFIGNSAFGGVVTGSIFLNDLVGKAIAGKTETKEKIEAIYAFVKGNIGWDGYYRKYSDENLKKVIENKKGSSAEINLMLVSMLQKGGIKAYPLLISTRDHGLIKKEAPIESQFNYVIAAAELDGKYFLMDATDRSLPMNILPQRCLNGEGFLIRG